MSTLQKYRQKEVTTKPKVHNWENIFPAKVETQQASLIYVKRLLTYLP